MAIANFELNFTDGEIHYKTIIDVGDDISFALIKQLQSYATSLQHILAELQRIDLLIQGVCPDTKSSRSP